MIFYHTFHLKSSVCRKKRCYVTIKFIFFFVANYIKDCINADFVIKYTKTKGGFSI